MHGAYGHSDRSPNSTVFTPRRANQQISRAIIEPAFTNAQCKGTATGQNVREKTHLGAVSGGGAVVGALRAA
jgi:hypothetical protein